MTMEAPSHTTLKYFGGYLKKIEYNNLCKRNFEYNTNYVPLSTTMQSNLKASKEYFDKSFQDTRNAAKTNVNNIRNIPTTTTTIAKNSPLLSIAEELLLASSSAVVDKSATDDKSKLSTVADLVQIKQEFISDKKAKSKKTKQVPLEETSNKNISLFDQYVRQTTTNRSAGIAIVSSGNGSTNNH